MTLTLKECAAQLRAAKSHVESVLDYFRNQDLIRSSRLGEISQRIADEIAAVERLISKGAKNG